MSLSRTRLQNVQNAHFPLPLGGKRGRRNTGRGRDRRGVGSHPAPGRGSLPSLTYPIRCARRTAAAAWPAAANRTQSWTRRARWWQQARLWACGAFPCVADAAQMCTGVLWIRNRCKRGGTACTAPARPFGRQNELHAPACFTPTCWRCRRVATALARCPYVCMHCTYPAAQGTGVQASHRPKLPSGGEDGPAQLATAVAGAVHVLQPRCTRSVQRNTICYTGRVRAGGRRAAKRPKRPSRQVSG